MALIREFTAVQADRNAIHDEVECGWRVFTVNGRTVLQLDTYGRPGREIPGKVSQSIQIDRQSAKELMELLRRTFGD